MIIDNDKRYQAFLKNISKPVQIKVGVLEKGADKHEDSELLIGELLTIHEFGLGQPERPVIRGWFDAQKKENEEITLGRIYWALKNRKPLIMAAEQAAVKLAASCQNRMVSGWTYQDISDETKRRKKSRLPLIDTGVIKSAIVGEASYL